MKIRRHATSRVCFVFVVVLGLVATSRTAGAQEQDVSYEASATVTRQTFEQSRGASVVTREEADERGAANASDVLQEASGVTVQRTASGSGTPILRGLTGYQVLMMVDDLRLNDALTRAGGSASLNLIDPESIASIEVIRGPASVLYGSDALGGVVEVRTEDAGARLGAPMATTASVYGRAASAEQSLGVRGHVKHVDGAWGGRVSGGRSSSGEVIRGDRKGTQPYTGHDAWSMASSIEHRLSRNHRLELSQQSGHLFDMPRPDASSPEDMQTTRSLDRDSGLLIYDGRLLDRALRLHAFAGVVSRREHRERLRPDNEQLERDHVVNLQLGVRGSGAPFPSTTLEVGAESSIERIRSRALSFDESGEAVIERGRYVDESHYDMHALYALATHELVDDFTLLAGGRGTLVVIEAPADELFESLLGSEATVLDRTFLGGIASVGTRLDLSESVAWVVSLLGGFRAPNLEDFQAYGGGARGFTLPTQDLREERSWTLETGLTVRSRAWHAEAFVFGSALSGLVVRVPTTLDGETEIEGEPLVTRRNASSSRLAGGELALTHTWEAGVYAGGAAWLTWGETTRPNEAGDDIEEPASKLPGPTGALRLGYAKPGSIYFGEVVLTHQLDQTRLSEGDRMDVRLCPDETSCPRVDGYTDLTLRSGAHIDQGLMLTVAIENLLNNDYKTYASGAYAPGRNFIAALRGTL